MRILLGVLLLLFNTTAGADALSVSGAWVREAPPGAMALAGYMVVHNGNGEERVLTGASSPDFRSIMMHRTEQDGGIARMTHADRLPIAAGGQLTFQPNGYHLMLMQPARPLHAGDEVTIRLLFDQGIGLDTRFRVRRNAPAAGE